LETEVFISSAYAQAATGSMESGYQAFLLPVVMIAVFYFILIRPQMKRAKEQKTMIEALQKGDEVVTAGGVLGKVTKLGDTYVSIEIAPGTEVQAQRSAVQTLLPKGTIKSL
jgi:preprotein translocase subunit YajC